MGFHRAAKSAYPALDHRFGHGREHRHRVPDRRAGESDDGGHTEACGGTRGVLHLLGRPLPYALGVAVAPDPCRQDAPVPLVDRVVAHGLPDQVVGDRPHAEVVLRQRLPLALGVGVVGERPVHLEVVTPAGDLQAVVPPLGGEPAHLLEGQVGPLAGEERDRSRHHRPPRARCGHWAAAPTSGCSTCVQTTPTPPSGLTASSTSWTCSASANDGRRVASRRRPPRSSRASRG